jgi:hypothetical protein
MIALLLMQPARADGPVPGKECVDVMVGSVQSYACLNQELQRLTEDRHRTNPLPDVHVDSPAPATGTFNQAATRERLGNAFGHSVIPQRPAIPAPVLPMLTR